jgi:hypothetical protein
MKFRSFVRSFVRSVSQSFVGEWSAKQNKGNEHPKQLKPEGSGMHDPPMEWSRGGVKWTASSNERK